MRNLFLLLFIFSATISFAQAPSSATTTSLPTKTVIGYFNYDSVLVLIPEYKEAADSAKIYKEALDKQQLVMENELDKKKTRV